MKEYIKIPEKGKYELTMLVELLDYLRSMKWKFVIWKFSPALIDKSGGTVRQYLGQKFDEKYFDLVEDGWTHDHCEICNEEITDEDKGYQAEDNDWVCESCYELLIKPNNISEVLESLKEK